MPRFLKGVAEMKEPKWKSAIENRKNRAQQMLRLRKDLEAKEGVSIPSQNLDQLESIPNRVEKAYFYDAAGDFTGREAEGTGIASAVAVASESYFEIGLKLIAGSIRGGNKRRSEEHAPFNQSRRCASKSSGWKEKNPSGHCSQVKD